MKCPPLVANDLSAFGGGEGTLVGLRLTGGTQHGLSGIPGLRCGAGDEGARSDSPSHRWTFEVVPSGRDPRDLGSPDAAVETAVRARRLRWPVWPAPPTAVAEARPAGRRPAGVDAVPGALLRLQRPALP